MIERIDPQVVKLWLDRLRNGSVAEREQAASELSRNHIRSRGAVRTRGSARAPAANDFPNDIHEDAMSALLAAMQDQSPSVRREVAFAIGEWGNRDAAAILSQILLGDQQDPEEEVRRAAVAALGTIGGPTAMDGLSQVAGSDASESVRYDALAALTELGIQQQSASNVAARHPPRVRGSIPTRPRAPESQSVVTTLQLIRDDESEKRHIRRMAENALGTLSV